MIPCLDRPAGGRQGPLGLCRLHGHAVSRAITSEALHNSLAIVDRIGSLAATYPTPVLEDCVSVMCDGYHFSYSLGDNGIYRT